MAVRDLLKIAMILDVKLVLTNIILETICQIYNWTISDVLLTKSFLYYQQGNKSLTNDQFYWTLQRIQCSAPLTVLTCYLHVTSHVASSIYATFL